MPIRRLKSIFGWDLLRKKVPIPLGITEQVSRSLPLISQPMDQVCFILGMLRYHCSVCASLIESSSPADARQAHLQEVHHVYDVSNNDIFISFNLTG